MSSVQREDLYFKIIQAGDICGYTFFRNIKQSAALEYRKTISRQIWQGVLLVGLLLYQLFVAIQCIRAMTDDTVDSKQFIGMLYVAVVNVMLSINHYTQKFQGWEYVRLMNSFRAFISVQKSNSKYKAVTKSMVNVMLDNFVIYSRRW